MAQFAEVTGIGASTLSRLVNHNIKKPLALDVIIKIYECRADEEDTYLLDSLARANGFYPADYAQRVKDHESMAARRNAQLNREHQMKNALIAGVAAAGCGITVVDRPILLRYSSSPYYADYVENGEQKFKLRNCRKINYGDATACKEMLLAGAGIAVDLNLGMVRTPLNDQSVVAVLPQWHRPVARAHIYCRNENKNSPLYQEILKLMVQSGQSDQTSPWRAFSKSIQSSG